MKWVKRIVLIIAAVILGAFLRGLYANNLNNTLEHISLGKEINKMVFAMNYSGFIPVGQAIIENKGIEPYGGKTARHIKAEAKLAKTFNWFYKVKVEANSFIDEDKGYPLEFSYLSELYGDELEAKRSIYDQVNHTMIRKGEKRLILNDTYDPLSAIFYIMRQDFEIGKTFDLNINTSQKNYRFYAEILKKKEIKVKDSAYELYLIKGSVKRRDDSFRHSSEFSIWFMDKPYKVPVIMSAFTNAGIIQGKLIEAN